MAGWTAAAATVVVTPSRSVPLAGYAARSEASAGTLDELEVNILVLRSPDGERVAWVSIDSVAITPPLESVLRARMAALSGVDPQAIILLASHTHSAPSGWVGSILPALPAAVDQRLLAELHDALGGFSLEEEAVELLPAITTVTGASANRQAEDGPHDPTASVTLVRRLGDSTPLALLYDFACHPTVLGPGNLLFSADWVGAARSALRAGLGHDLPVIFAQGSAGDVSTRFRRQGQDKAETEEIGRIVARALLRALSAAIPLRQPELSIHRREMAFPSRWEDGSISVGLSLIHLGPQRFLCIPAEVCASLGLALTVPHPDLRILSCADGYLGYLADSASHDARRYEALASPFDAPTTAELIARCAAWITEDEQGTR